MNIVKQMQKAVTRSSKKMILGAVLSFLVVGSFAQFEGVIAFNKKKGKTTVQYKYYVKGDNVRIEELSDDGSVDGIQLVDLKEKKIVAISPGRMLYMDVPNNRSLASATTKVEKTKLTKTINGKKCTKWVVTNTAQDRQIEYWVSKDGYNFFTPLLKTLNRREKQSVYFLSVPGTEGFFPMLGEEKTLKGLTISTLEVTEVLKKDLSGDLFKIPANYKKLER